MYSKYKMFIIYFNKLLSPFSAWNLTNEIFDQMQRFDYIYWLYSVKTLTSFSLIVWPQKNRIPKDFENEITGEWTSGVNSDDQS